MKKLNTLLEIVVEQHKSFFAQAETQHQSLSPMFIAIKADGSAEQYLVDIENEQQKQMLCDQLSEHFKSTNVQYYAFFTEAWAAIYQDRQMNVQPSKREDRTEIVLTIVADNEGNKLGSTLEMVRDWNTNRVVELKEYEMNATAFSGRFAELLD